MSLTATGALLYRYAERILAKSNDTVNAARDLRELRTGKLHIAASQTPGVYHAPRLIGAPATTQHSYDSTASPFVPKSLEPSQYKHQQTRHTSSASLYPEGHIREAAAASAGLHRLMQTCHAAC